MRALQYVDRGRAEVVELPVPDIADDEVLVAARSVGVCHSDIDLLEGRYIIPFSYPLIPGHEWSGEVAAVGSKVSEFAPGDRVVGECVIGEDHFGFSISGAAAEQSKSSGCGCSGPLRISMPLCSTVSFFHSSRSRCEAPDIA